MRLVESGHLTFDVYEDLNLRGSVGDVRVDKPTSLGAEWVCEVDLG